MKVVCDTSSIIKLQRGGVIDCLGQLFETVLIPQAVKEECQKPETINALHKPFFEVRHVSRILPLSGIHRGEQEAISLAVERNIAVIILDDEKAFRRAWEQGLTPIRSFRVLLLAKRKGLIPSVKSALDEMIAKGEGIQEEIYRKMLEESGETPDS
jgi:predicted nucleic acid-binding protein